MCQKFTQNHCMCYSFRDIHNFSFSAKIQGGRKKWRTQHSFTTLWVKNSLENSIRDARTPQPREIFSTP